MTDIYTVSCDKAKLDFEIIYQFIASSYWARGIPRATLKTALDNSLCFGVYDNNDELVGFARVITDYATFGYLADVFINEAHRGQGLSKKLMDAIKAHPALQGLRRMVLVTADAHSLYQQYEFKALSSPESYMECWTPDIYHKNSA